MQTSHVPSLQLTIIYKHQCIIGAGYFQGSRSPRDVTRTIFLGTLYILNMMAIALDASEYFKHEKSDDW